MISLISDPGRLRRREASRNVYDVLYLLLHVFSRSKLARVTNIVTKALTLWTGSLEAEMYMQGVPSGPRGIPRRHASLPEMRSLVGDNCPS